MEKDSIFDFGELDDASIEWRGMPEYKQDDLTAWHQIKVSFENEQDLMEFGERLGIVVTPRTRATWFPAHAINRVSHLFYYDENNDEHTDSDQYASSDTSEEDE